MKCVYMIQNIVNNKIYIGSTSEYEKRKRSHINGIKGLYHDNRLINEDAKIYGHEAFKFRVLFVSDDEEERFNLEEELIKRLQTYINGYNLSIDGRGKFIVSDDFREKCRARATGVSNPFYGRKHTRETKDILSKLASQRTGNKNPFYGKTHSQESIEKARESFNKLKESGWVNPQKGVPKSKEAILNNAVSQPKRKEIFAEGKRYISISACAKDLNISRATVRNRVNNDSFPDYYYIDN